MAGSERFFDQDWGGLIGLRLVANHKHRFDRVVISNTGLPYNPDVPEEVRQIEEFRASAPTPSLIEMQRALGGMADGEHAARKFAYWQKFCWETEDIPIGLMMSMMMENQSRPMQALKLLLHKLGASSPLPRPLSRAYEAPFPNSSYKIGPRAMPCPQAIICGDKPGTRPRHVLATNYSPIRLQVWMGDHVRRRCSNMPSSAQGERS